MSGQWSRGKSMLEAALARNPGRAGYYHGIVALADYMQKDNLAAVAQIRQADQQKFPLFQLVAAIVYQQAGMPDEMARASASFAKLGPEFLVHLRDEIDERVLQPQDKERIIESLRKADYARRTTRAWLSPAIRPSADRCAPFGAQSPTEHTVCYGRDRPRRRSIPLVPERLTTLWSKAGGR